jgi:hypothetical protein
MVLAADTTARTWHEWPARIGRRGDPAIDERGTIDQQHDRIVAYKLQGTVALHG